MNYQINTRQFSGPIEALLEMIESRKMEITEVNMAEVTADFLNYVQTFSTRIKATERSDDENPDEFTSINPRLLADFIVIASKLLLIKSKALLPNIELSAEDEREIKDLETQLKFFREFKPAINNLKKLWERERFSVSRPLMAGRPPIFYPTESITGENLRRAMNSIFEEIKKLSIETKTVKSTIISLEEKVEEIIQLLENAARNKEKNGSSTLQFDKLKKEKNRVEIIVMFLALLHLLHEQFIKVEQKSRFSDIMIRQSEPINSSESTNKSE